MWRLRPYPLTRAPAYCIDRARNLYTFSILGNDTPLVTKPVPEPSPTHIATVDNVPAFIPPPPSPTGSPTTTARARASPSGATAQDEPVPPADIVVADLSEWRYRPRRGQVAVDPVLGPDRVRLRARRPGRASG